MLYSICTFTVIPSTSNLNSQCYIMVIMANILYVCIVESICIVTVIPSISNFNSQYYIYSGIISTYVQTINGPYSIWVISNLNSQISYVR